MSNISNMSNLIENGELIPNWNETISDFSTDLVLHESILRGLVSSGVSEPNQLQKLALKPLLLGRDSIIQSLSGSGKSVTMVISALQAIDTSKSVCQSIILVPNKEDARRISDVISAIGIYSDVKHHVCVSGLPVEDDKKALSEGIHLVIGTPGRVDDLIRRKALDLGWKDLLCHFLQLLPSSTQKAIFCVSIPFLDVIQIVEEYLKDPAIIVLKREVVLQTIKHFSVAHLDDDNAKGDFLVHTIVATENITNAVIFCSTCNRAEFVTQLFKNSDIPAAFYHSNMEPEQRKDVLDGYRKGRVRYLVTINQYARSLGVQASLVINYDIPTANNDDYLHHCSCVIASRPHMIINLTNESEYVHLKRLESLFSFEVKDYAARLQ